LKSVGREVLLARSRWRFTGSERPSWAERPAPGRESVWDYPRPPRIEPETRRVRVAHRGVAVAESARALRVLETAGAPTLYLPPADVDLGRLAPNAGVSFCEWKGRARLFDVLAAGDVLEAAAWCYPDPYPEFEAIRGWLAFHPGRLSDCWLAETRATPQPGGYYGGWVTPDLAGPIKGGPGSAAW